MQNVPHHTIRRYALRLSLIGIGILIPTAALAYVLSSAERSGLLLVLVVLACAILIIGSWLLLIRALCDYSAKLVSLWPSDHAATASHDLCTPRHLSEQFKRLADRATMDQHTLQRYDDELETLSAISQALNHTHSLDTAMDIVLDQVPQLHPCTKRYIALSTAEQRLEIAASAGYTDDEIEEQTAHVRQNDLPPGLIKLPLEATSGTIGLLVLDADPLDEDTHRSLDLLANILAISVEKHRLLEAAEREIRAQKLLNEAGRVLTSTLDEQEVLTRVMHEVTQALNAEAGSVVLVDANQKDMYFAAAVSPRSETLVDTRLPLGHGIVGWTIEHGESVLATDAHNDPRFYRQIDQQTGFHTKSIVCVPLFSKDHVIGAIELMNPRNGHFTPHDLQVLESLAPQAAIAIENAFLFESVKTQMAELERTQNQLLQAEKMSAIGRLVAGVAHELNNPLTAIVGYSQLLLETCQDRETREDLERINREAQRSARIVQNLLAFSRQQKMTKRPVELNSILEKTIDLLSYQLQVDNVTIVSELSPQQMRVMGDNYQLQQVFINIVTNAHHAMRSAHGRGTLIIRSERTTKGTARIYFTDDGPGISSEIAGRVFDPFFTTKDVGEGTGLGLSICLGIVQEHDGEIWLQENQEVGATFVVELPLYRDRSQRTKSGRSHAPESPTLDQLSILVVDDEQEITALLRRVLEAKGHKVTTVHDGLQARQMLEQWHFDIVICDLKMPGMDGQELYAHIKRAHPELAERVIFSTGDTVSEDSWSFLSQTQDRYISKPFKPSQVLAKIRETVAE